LLSPKSPRNSRVASPQIVKDIRRRLFPNYYRDLDICRTRHAEHLGRMKGVANAALHFGAILKVTPPEVDDQERARFHLGFVGSVWGHIEVDTQSVDLKLDGLPFDIAATMLVPLGEYIAQHPKEKDE
jgi:hypothetical protein